MTVLDVEDPKEIEYILAVRYFHEYELTDDHLRVAKISLVKVLYVAKKKAKWERRTQNPSQPGLEKLKLA